MLFKGTHKETASIALLAFQSGRPSYDLDNDWVETGLRATINGQSWHVIDPALTAKEVHELSQWLYHMANNVPVEEDMEFCEPVLSFHLILNRPESKTIKIVFNAEFKPSWIPGEQECSMVCILSNNDLDKLARELYQSIVRMFETNTCKKVA